MKFQGESTTKVCTMVDMVCYYLAENRFGTDLVVDECDCLPSCMLISYSVEISQAQSKYGATQPDSTFNETGSDGMHSLFT